MTKTMRMVHGLVILAILGFAFYWFQWRPNQIRKECANRWNNLKDYNNYYEKCLNEHGIK